MACLPVIGPSRNSNFVPSLCFCAFVANKTLIKKWILKAAIQKALAYLPGGHRMNYWLQKYVTRGVRLDEAHFRQKLEHAVITCGFTSSMSAPCAAPPAWSSAPAGTRSCR